MALSSEAFKRGPKPKSNFPVDKTGEPKAKRKPGGKPFKKGEVANPKGRPPGIPNKRSVAARELAERLNIDPLEILLKMADNRFEELNPHLKGDQLNNKDGVPKSIAMETRRMAADSAAKFLYPTMKAIELTGKDGNPLEQYTNLTPTERAARLEQLNVALGDD